MDVVSICVAIFLLFVIWKAYARPKGFPPGPRGVPLLGYIPFIKEHDPEHPFRAMMKLSDIYGPVVGFYMGPSQPFVSVCGFDAVREALHNDDLNGRPDLPAQRELTYGKKFGIKLADGHFWQEQRRFTLRHLRDLGFGTRSIENMIFDEIGQLLDEIEQSSGSSPHRIVNYRGIFNVSVVNILWTIAGGQRFRRDDADFKKLLQTLNFVFRSGDSVKSIVPVPTFLLHLFPKLREYLGVRNNLLEELQRYFESVISEHDRTLREGEPRDFIDVYLEEVRRQKSTDSTFTVEQLICIIMDMFAAGAESVSNAIGFALLYLIHYPDVQRKMHEELDAVCGSSLPSLSMRIDLPYTEAVLMEAQRISNIAPVTIPHYAVRETKLNGFTIPKGSMVQINVHSVHNEVAYWKDPHVFRPERHLSADGTIIRSEHLMPFAGGKRKCLGQSLAKHNYYLFVTALIKTFKLSAVPGQPLPTLNPIEGFTLGYEGFQAVTQPRSSLP